MQKISLYHFIFALTLFGFIFPNGASFAEINPLWTVSSVSGDALFIQSEEQQQPLRRRQTLNVGDRVETGDDGKVVIARGQQSVLITANSSFEIRPTKSDLFTRIFQRFGILMFRVDKRPSKHFQVDTPYLHAVVKGTTFTVSVDEGGAAVHVTEGLVEVTGPAASQNDPVARRKFLVARGYTASISAGQGRRLQIGVSTDVPQAAKHGHQIKSDLGASRLNIEKASKGLLRRASAGNEPVAKGKAKRTQSAQKPSKGKPKGTNNRAQKWTGSLPPDLGDVTLGHGAESGLGGGASFGKLVGENASNGKGKSKGKGKGKNK